MDDSLVDRPDAPAPVPALEPPVSRKIVPPLPERSPVPGRGVRLLPIAVYALGAANLLALWLARDVYVNGWDLFGQTFGVLTLGQGSFADAVWRIYEATLHQYNRPVFTGGESVIYGLLPGLLSRVQPWLLWSHFLNLVLFVLVSTWLVRRLRVTPYIYWACVLASPALVSLSITGLPDLPSTAVPFGLAIGWVLLDRRRERGVVRGLVVDALALVTIAAIAFSGYESGKTFFVVPAVAALTVRGVPLVRRASWLAGAVAVARVVNANRAMTTRVALEAVPSDPLALLGGLAKVGWSYVGSWYIDCPALAVAALVCLPFMRTHRPFWAVLWAAVLGLVTLNAFQLDGAFLVPHRFLLLGFVSALVVSVALSRSPRRGVAAVAALLLAIGIADTTYETIRFATVKRPMTSGNWNVDHTYALPYNRALLDAQIWPDRIHDARVLVDVVRRGREAHVLFYGFSVAGEDSVNPQLFVSRLLLPLGWAEFSSRIRFFDHMAYMYFPFPIAPLADVPATLRTLPTPFFVHVREPEYSGASIVARYLNAARVEPVDLGLTSFRSYRVDAFAPPGPIPVPPLDGTRASVATGDATGVCLTTWDQRPAEQSPLQHWDAPLPQHVRGLLAQAHGGGAAWRFMNVARAVTPVPEARLDRAVAAALVGRFDNSTGQPMPAVLEVSADDEVAVLVSDQTIVETRGQAPRARFREALLLPPGPGEIMVLYRKFWYGGAVAFRLVDGAGRPIPLACPDPR